MSYDRLKKELQHACEALDGELYEDKVSPIGSDDSGVFREENEQIERSTCFIEDKGRIEILGEKEGSQAETRVKGQNVNAIFEESVQVMDAGTMDEGHERILIGNISTGNTVELTTKNQTPASRNRIKKRRQRVGRQGYRQSKQGEM